LQRDAGQIVGTFPRGQADAEGGTTAAAQIAPSRFSGSWPAARLIVAGSKPLL